MMQQGGPERHVPGQTHYTAAFFFTVMTCG